MSWVPTVAISKVDPWPNEVRVVRNMTDEYQVYVPMLDTCHMESVRDYQVSEYATSWGCICSECGGFHEFYGRQGMALLPELRTANRGGER